MNITLTFLRRMSNTSKPAKKSHYDSLGVSAKATQADIKSAYYKLSMIHHPDKSKNNEESQSKFRDISEAYEVLGNVKSRKLYDRGLLIDRSPGGIHTKEPPMSNFHNKTRTSAPAYGRTTVYDFDEWSKAHYGHAFRNLQMFRERENQKRVTREMASEQARKEKLAFVLLFLFGSYWLFVICNSENVNDKVKYGKTH